MKQFVLLVEPSLWNVLKFLALSFFITPFLETLLDSLIVSRATLSIRRGAKLQIFDSRLGVFALHSRYAGSRHNRLWLIASAVFILCVELMLEFSFSSTQIRSSATKDVWVGPRHSDRYLTFANASFDDEPTRIIDEVSVSCIEGRRIMNRSEASDAEYSEVLAQYSLSANYTIRKPYMLPEDTMIVCDSESTTKSASFVTTNIVGYDGVEGFDSLSGPTVPINDSWFQITLSENFTIQGSFKFDEILMYIYLAKRTVCVGPDEVAGSAPDHLCAISNASTIAIGISSSPKILRRIAMFMSGEGIKPLHEKSRKIRFLAHLAEKRVLTPAGAAGIEAFVIKYALEQIAMVALAVASEEGVVGLEQSRALRNVAQRQMRQVTTISAIGVIPLTILGLFALIVTCWDLIVRLKIWKSDGRRRGPRRALFPDERVEMSKQWLWKTVRADLMRMGLCSATEGDVCVRVASNDGTARLRVLPLIPDRTLV